MNKFKLKGEALSRKLVREWISPHVQPYVTIKIVGSQYFIYLKPKYQKDKRVHDLIYQCEPDYKIEKI